MPSLVKETRVEDWDIFTCINCNMDTHALHAVKKYDRVLINRALEVRRVLAVSLAQSKTDGNYYWYWVYSAFYLTKNTSVSCNKSAGFSKLSKYWVCQLLSWLFESVMVIFATFKASGVFFSSVTFPLGVLCGNHFNHPQRCILHTCTCIWNIYLLFILTLRKGIVWRRIIALFLLGRRWYWCIN